MSLMATTDELYDEITAVTNAGQIIYAASLDAVSRENWKAFDVLRNTHKHLKDRMTELRVAIEASVANPFIA